MLSTAFRFRRTTWFLRLHAVHLVTEGPSPLLLSTLTVLPVVEHLVVVVKIHQMLNEIE